MNKLLTQDRITNPLLPNLEGQTGAEATSSLIGTLITVGFIVGIVFFVFNLIFGAVQWITSGGDKGNVESARGRITHAAIGLFVLFVIYAFINAIQIIFSVTITNLTLPTLGG